MYLVLSVAPGTLVNLFTVPSVKNLVICPRPVPSRACVPRCKKPGHVARQCGQAGGQPRPSSSSPVPVDPVPVDPIPVDPVPVTGSEDDGDLSSVSSDHPDPPAPAPDPVPVPVPVPVPSYLSLTVDDVPRRPRTKHTKRLSTEPTAFPFCSPKVPVLPRSKPVSFRKRVLFCVGSFCSNF